MTSDIVCSDKVGGHKDLGTSVVLESLSEEHEYIKLNIGRPTGDLDLNLQV